MIRLFPKSIVLCLLCFVSVATAGDAALDAMFTDYDVWVRETSPETAVGRGDLGAISRLDDRSIIALDAAYSRQRVFLAQATGLSTEGFSETERLYHQLFIAMLEDAITDHELGGHYLLITPRWGPHHWVAGLVGGIPLRNQRDWNRYLERLDRAPRALDQMIALLQRGLERGMTPPRVAIEGVPGQVAALLEPGGLDMLREPLAATSVTMSTRDRESIRLRLEGIAIPAVRGRLQRFHEFLQNEYLPGCRTTLAATALPGGESYYAFQLRVMTTTDMTAQEIYDLGHYEVSRLRSEMLLAIRRTDYLELFPERAEQDDLALLAGFIEYLRTDARFYFENAEALVERYKVISKTIDGRLPALFRVLPRTPYGVKVVPDAFAPQQTTAYYEFGNMAAGEPGWFVVNTYALDQRPRYEMVPLTLHEAMPGHHLQSSLASEVTGMPGFRQGQWFNAYGEGWALYAERLGIEMGMFEDPYDDFGRLLYEMWRACRLVVDPGIHAFGWTREQAVEFMMTNTALSEHNIRAEVDRYIAWPGQACGYKIGELRIRSMRSDVERRLGGAFDIREFHEIILGAGSLPLDVLEERVERWLATKPLGAAYD